MNHNNIDILVGFSGNPEFSVLYDGRSQEAKIPIEDVTLSLSGSSITVASAIKQLNAGVYTSCVLLATAEEEDWRDTILRYCLERSGLRYELLKIRERCRSGIAFQFIPRGQLSRVVGDKGAIVSYPIERVQALVREHPSAIRIATGIRSDEATLAAALFSKSSGSRVLNPNAELCRHSALHSLIEQVDFLIWNDYEFGQFLRKDARALTFLDFAKLRELSVPLIVVTMNSSGAMLVHHGKVELIEARTFDACYSEVGAGDWWLAAFLSYILRNGQQDLRSLPEQVVMDAAQFAALAAGLKVTYQGGSVDGPTMIDIVSHQ